MGFGALSFLSEPVFNAAGSAVGVSLSCQSCVSFSQSSFFSQTNQTSLLFPALLSEIKPSFDPSELQKG